MENLCLRDQNLPFEKRTHVMRMRQDARKIRTGESHHDTASRREGVGRLPKSNTDEVGSPGLRGSGVEALLRNRQRIEPRLRQMTAPVGSSTHSRATRSESCRSQMM